MLVINRNALGNDTPNRIRTLQEERLQIQMKTFTNWINSYLPKDDPQVRNLFLDLSDGKILLKLLQTIAGEEFAQPTEGKFRAHKIENVYKCLSFLNSKVRLESIGPEDIVDGNPCLVMGLIWTIIARFEIQEILVDMNDHKFPNQSRSLTAKAALLLWCQQRTVGYPGVEVNDFSSSWRDGLAFNALVHHFRPDLIKFDKLEAVNYLHNLNNAFSAAEEGLDIPKLLDAEDFGLGKPDEKSVITYLSSFYHHCSKLDDDLRPFEQASVNGLTGKTDSSEKITENEIVASSASSSTLEAPPPTTEAIDHSRPDPVNLTTSGQHLDERPVVTEWTCGSCRRRHPPGVYLCTHCRERREAISAPASPKMSYGRREINRSTFAVSVATKPGGPPPGVATTSLTNGGLAADEITETTVTNGGAVTTTSVTRIVPANTVEDKNHGLSVIGKFLTRRKLFDSEPVTETKTIAAPIVQPDVPKLDAQQSAKINVLECEIIFLKEQYFQQLDVFETKLDEVNKQLNVLSHAKSQLESMLDEMKSNSGELKTKIRAVENSVLVLRTEFQNS